MTGIQKRYGGVHALRDGRLTILKPGECHALVGANGSGKSTLLGILSGQQRLDSGVVRINGDVAHFRNAHAAVRAGVVMVSQETAVAPDLTVAENVLLGRRQVRTWSGVSRVATRRKAAEVLQRLDLDLDLDAPVGRLATDQQQLVEIARALSMDARLAILDEPTSSLTDDQVASLSAAVKQLTRQGVSVLYVSHRFHELYELCSRVTVLRDGVTVLEGTLQQTSRDSLVAAMVGSSTPGQQDQGETPPAEKADRPVLRVNDLSTLRGLRDVSFTSYAGEIVGIAGLGGSGRGELLETIFGLVTPTKGSIDVDGEHVGRATPRTLIRRGVGYLPPDRKLQGVVLQQSIETNLLMPTTLSSSRFRAPTASDRNLAKQIATDLGIKSDSIHSAVQTLSGGNQQKVAIGKWLAMDLKVLLLDEPTRGVDVAAKQDIHLLMKGMASRGIGILVSSSENDELREVCDRVLVMVRGRIAASLTVLAATDDNIAAIAGGHG